MPAGNESPPFVSVGQSASVALSTTYAAVELKANSEYPRSGAPKELVYAHQINIRVTDISSATQLVWKLCEDQDGDYALMPETTSTIETGENEGTNGTVTAVLNTALWLPGLALWLHVKTDAGTANMTRPSATWSL